MSGLVSRGLRTICFAKSRKAAELDPPLHGRPGRHRDRRPAGAVPRRLHARAAARDRAAADGRRAARGLGDRCARARHRHRRARLRDLGGLPRHRRLAAPAVGPGRAPRPRARGAGRERGRARPVLHARARGAARAPGRGDAARSREPADPRPARVRGGLRGADPAGRRRHARARGARARRAAARSSSARPAGFVWKGRDSPAGTVLAPLGRPGLVHDRRRHDRLGPRARRARARVLDRARGSRLPPPRRAVPRAGARRRRPHRDRRAGQRRLVHAGEEGHRDRDRAAAALGAAPPASTCSSAASR